MEEKGWVIVVARKNGLNYLRLTFSDTRAGSILRLITGTSTTWKQFKKIGYRCVKATMTIRAFDSEDILIEKHSK